MTRALKGWRALAAPLLVGTVMPFAVFLAGVTIAFGTALPPGSDVYGMGVVATGFGIFAWAKYGSDSRLLLFAAGGLMMPFSVLLEGWWNSNSSIAGMVPMVRDCVYPLVTALVVGGVAVACVRLVKRVLQKETPPGRCLCCRYDLTGNTSGRCPECGGAVRGSS